MSSTIPGTYTTALVLRFGVPLSHMTEDEFVEFCQLNPDVRAERGPNGEVDIMSPTGGETGRRNHQISLQLGIWSEQTKLGVVFDSSTGFRLPNTARRSPDAAWILKERWEQLSADQREQSPPLAPDFVLELFSKNDRLTDLRMKMQEYVGCGVRLGWLIDPYARRVEVYRPGQTVVELQNPDTISADPELPGFALDLTKIW